MKIKSIAEKIFTLNTPLQYGKGLFVTVEDFLAQRRYAYEWQPGKRHKFTSQQAGDVKSIFKGRGMEFEEIRAYTFGDDVRDIDWRVTARKQSPYTKLYTEEKDREVYALLDLSSQMIFGTKKQLKSVTASEITAQIAWQCLNNKDRFGCIIHHTNGEILLKAKNSQASMMLIFKKIAETSRAILRQKLPKNEETLKKAVNLLQQTIKHRAIVFIISDFSDFS